MADPTINLVGGMLQGFTGAKNQAQQTAMMNEYRKTQTDMIKLEAKTKEADLKLKEFQHQMEAPIYQAIAQTLQGGGAPQAPQAQPAAQPFAQFQPPQPAQQSIPDMVAQGQMPSGINIPGDPANNISVRQNNPGNLKFVGQEGATSGTRGFAAFPSPEAGFTALQNQIETDKARNLTLAQFANKYAPPFENDTNNWIKVVGNFTGATPDTPISAIPTPLLAQGVAKIESGATIGGGMGTPQQAMQPRQAQYQPAQQPLVTGEKLLEGFLKKKFGVEPDEAKVVPYGDHKLVTNKKGTPLFIIAGQGKMEMVDIKQADGSVIRKPQLIPPSPLPGGIPVYNVGGQPMSNMAGPGGVQTAPPEVTRQEVGLPGGGKAMIPLPKAQLGQAPIQTEPPKGASAAEAGKIQLAQSGLDAYSQARNLIVDPKTGKSNWGNLGNAVGPGVPWTQGKQIKGLIMRSMDAIVRAATGAALSNQELKAYTDMYSPSVFDNEQTVQGKLKGLQGFLNGYLEKMDPTGTQRMRIGTPTTPQQNTGPMTAEDYLKKKGLK